MDDTLIKATAEYASFGNVDDIYFLTVVKSLEIPASLKKDYPDLTTPKDERMKSEMKDSIQAIFGPLEYNFHFDVLEGNPTKQIIHWVKVKEIDLVILGKKSPSLSHRVTAQKIVNIVQCSVLFVAENCKIEPKTILVPTDFSDASYLALQKARAIGNIVNASITVLHTYEVPTGYHSTGKTYDEFATIMLKHSMNDYSEFISKDDIGDESIKTEYLLDKHGHPDQLISEFAVENNFDLIVLGSKGRTSLSSVLLGSVAAKLVLTDFNVPILVVKGKDHNLNLIDAILQL